MKKTSWIIFGIIFIIILAIYLVNTNIKHEKSESKTDIYMDEQYDQDND
jgi:preprotein translocase subunit SecG